MILPFLLGRDKMWLSNSPLRFVQFSGRTKENIASLLQTHTSNHCQYMLAWCESWQSHIKRWDLGKEEKIKKILNKSLHVIYIYIQITTAGYFILVRSLWFCGSQLDDFFYNGKYSFIAEQLIFSPPFLAWLDHRPNLFLKLCSFPFGLFPDVKRYHVSVVSG